MDSGKYPNKAMKLPRQGSNLDSSDPESDVLPVTPQGSYCWVAKRMTEGKHSEASSGKQGAHPPAKGRMQNHQQNALLLSKNITFNPHVDPIGIEPTTSRVRF